MIFRPRIFISSTLSENLTIRNEIEEFFKNVGAEPMLYEKTLTPSIMPMSYRQDVLDADFIIFIIKDNYGKKTDSGKSGTHEEFEIALSLKVPKHVYIKSDKTSLDDDTKEFIEEINDNQISYYYFKNDDELLKRIKETTFTIAKEIMLDNIEKSDFPSNTVRKICAKHDYEKACEIITIIKTMIKYNEIHEYHYIYSNVFVEFISRIEFEKKHREPLFIDKKIEDILDEMLAIYKEFSKYHGSDFTTTNNINAKKYSVPLLGSVSLLSCDATIKSDSYYKYKDYEKMIDNFFEKYKLFLKYISDLRIEVDTII